MEGHHIHNMDHLAPAITCICLPFFLTILTSTSIISYFKMIIHFGKYWTMYSRVLVHCTEFYSSSYFEIKPTSIMIFLFLLCGFHVSFTFVQPFLICKFICERLNKSPLLIGWIVAQDNILANHNAPYNSMKMLVSSNNSYDKLVTSNISTSIDHSTPRPWSLLGPCLIPGWWLTEGNQHIGGNQFIIVVVGWN